MFRGWAWRGQSARRATQMWNLASSIASVSFPSGSGIRYPFRWRGRAAVVGSPGAVVGEVQGLTVDPELCRRRVGHIEPWVSAAVDANLLAGVVEGC